MDGAEIAALYVRPRFTTDEQMHCFSLTQPEKDVIPLFRCGPSHLFFLLQLGYFKAKQRFFAFAFTAVADDVR